MDLAPPQKYFFKYFQDFFQDFFQFFQNMFKNIRKIINFCRMYVVFSNLSSGPHTKIPRSTPGDFGLKLKAKNEKLDHHWCFFWIDECFISHMKKNWVDLLHKIPKRGHLCANKEIWVKFQIPHNYNFHQYWGRVDPWNPSCKFNLLYPKIST